MIEPSEQPPLPREGVTVLVVAVALIATTGAVAILAGPWKPAGIGVLAGFRAVVVSFVRDRQR